MKASEEINLRRSEIRRIAKSHGASNVRVFGSVARGDEHDDSDVDFLIDVTAEISPWFPVGLIQDLEALLGRRVEIVTERALNSDLRERVLSEAIPV